MSRTRHYRDLLVWQKAMDLVRFVYRETEAFPQSEVFGLRLQIRRAAVSVPSNIAEGHGRLTDPQLRNALGIARGSLYELQTQITLASDLKMVSMEAASKILETSTEVAKLINGLIHVLEP